MAAGNSIASRLEGLSPASVEVCATPEALEAKAQEVRSSVLALRRGFAALDGEVSASGQYWQGEAAEAHRERYRLATGETEALLQTLLAYADKLNTIAGNYRAAETALQQASAALPDDVIV